MFVGAGRRSTPRRLAGVVVVIVAALLGFTVTPAATVQTEPSPALPGSDPQEELPAGFQPPAFTYPSPHELLTLPQPPDQATAPEDWEIFNEYLVRLGDHKQYTPGTRAHFYARWRDHHNQRPEVTFDQYRAGYVNATKNRHLGRAYADFGAASEGLTTTGGWRFDQPIPGMPRPDHRRRPDAYQSGLPMREYKSGSESELSPNESRQLDAYVRMADREQVQVYYLFRNRPSQTVLDQAAAANQTTSQSVPPIVVRFLPARAQPVPIPEDPHAPPAPPVAQPTPGPAGGSAGALADADQYPVDSTLERTVAGSPDSAEDAAVGAEVAEEVAADFGDVEGDEVVSSDPPGGVDFSTLELRYVSDTYRGAGAQFAFRLDAAPDDQPGYGGQRAARLASDAFFVWLALPEHAFTVNLHPYEPDRIIHADFGRTDAGRVLLEADLQMKKTTGELIHPETSLGQEYWDALQGDKCGSMRQWIVPGPATVYETDTELFILDAPLEVKMESEHIQEPGAGAAGCGDDPAIQRHNDEVHRTTILPLIEEAVNEAPEYADLRRVYYSRVAAQWYRERSATKRTAYSHLINTGDISRWASREDWSPREVFDRYVESFTEGEFEVAVEEVIGNYIYETIYFYGGVDFTRVPQQRMSTDEFHRSRPSLAESVQSSLFAATGEQDAGEVWLGGMTTTRPINELPLDPPQAPTGNPLFYALIGAPVLAWLLIGGWLLARRWRRRSRGSTTPGYPASAAADG